MGSYGLIKAGRVASGCDPLSPRESSGKILDIVNFMNFGGGSWRFGPLEFAARLATSSP
jgi:hypothetical protein